MTPAEWADWTTVAEIEGRRFQGHLVALMWSGAIGGATVLGTMAAFDVSLKWMLVFAYAQGVLALGAMLNKMGARQEEGRSKGESLGWAIHGLLSQKQSA